MQSAAIFKALGEPLRLRIAHLLARREELCVCDLTALIDAPQSSMSRHLALMRHLGVVEARREGRWVHYRLCVTDVCAGLGERLRGLAEHEPVLAADAEQLAGFEVTDCGREGGSAAGVTQNTTDAAQGGTR